MICRSVGAAALALAVAGVGCDPPPGDNPWGGGGGGMTGGGSGRADAAANGYDDAGPGADAGAGLSGKVCRVVDLRTPGACPTADVGGVTVKNLDDDTTTSTAADGPFALPAATQPLPALAIAELDPGDHPSRFRTSVDTTGSAAGIVAPVMTETDWTALVLAIGASDPDGEAAVVVYVVDEGGPVAGADVDAPIGTVQAPYYDNGGAQNWRSDLPGTGAAGAALILSVPASNANVTLTVSSGGLVVSVTGVPVATATLTLVTVDLFGL
jgi:hypothetical protein